MGHDLSSHISSFGYEHSAVWRGLCWAAPGRMCLIALPAVDAGVLPRPKRRPSISHFDLPECAAHRYAGSENSWGMLRRAAYRGKPAGPGKWR